ncbi:hypothetical protein GCM10018785_37630 [Streptomyces longispororuber]|uniref:Uncharacterized protein n=1 Tax=Streptomyces longispororuber TaxID=68230 RepID=A0A919DPL7_9ACTN|nr:hypothetical protein [Streptomyces longispororuber]GHE65255.1 hypothetical protein GCM10018785_37630 [Streptomyces longispororuber]
MRDPELRDLVVDTERVKVGRVMGRVGGCLQLRPPGGGREWDADPARVRPADEDERLRAGIAERSLRRAPGRRSA